VAQHTEKPLTRQAHEWIGPALGPGSWAVDATAGNGHDTLFLAQSVAPGGRVDAFDIQAAALRRAHRRVGALAHRAHLRWHRADHARMPRHLGPAPIDAAMFNLGWHPGGDRRVVTRPESTLAALTAAAARLRPGGRISIVAYRGHPGGAAEADAVARWLERLGSGFRVEPAQPAAARADAPVLYRVCVAR